MYNYGIVRFLQAKQLKSKECIDGFLISEGITNFTSKNHNRVNKYIESNWTKFAAYCDKGLKSGELQGKAVKFNYYYDEQREYKEKVRQEYEALNLTPLQKSILKRITKEFGVGFLQSFLQKKGITPVGKNMDYFSKTLQWMDLVNLAIEHGDNENLQS